MERETVVRQPKPSIRHPYIRHPHARISLPLPTAPIHPPYDAFPLSASVDIRLGRSMAKVSELRELLGVATRRQSEMLGDNASLRDELRLERDRHMVLRTQHTGQTTELEQSQQSVSELRIELDSLQVSPPPPHHTTQTHARTHT